MKNVNYIKILKTLLIILICITCLLPFYVLIVLSLNDPSTLFYEGNMFLPDFHFSNYLEAFARSHILRAMLNSLIITLGSLSFIYYYRGNGRIFNC